MTRATALLFPVFLASLLLAAASVFAQVPQQPAPPKPLTVEAIFANGPLIGGPPDEIAWSPDGKHAAYMDGGQLMDVDPMTGKTHVLVSAEKLVPLESGNIPERDRDHRRRYHLPSYVWAPDADHLLFDFDGRLWLYDLKNGTGVQVGFSGLASGDDPKFSPDGKTISYIRDHGVTVINLREPEAPAAALTPQSNAQSPNGQLVLNGEVDWVYEEELDVRSNYFWSPDSKNLAYLQMNETQVPQYPLADYIPIHAQVDWQRYPQAGDANPDVQVGVIGAKGGKTMWVRLPIQPGDYIPRFGWVDRKTLWIETLSRDHKHRALFFADAEHGDAHLMLEIGDERFLDEDYGVSVGAGAIVLTNWSDGHNHLYLYSYNEARPLAAAARLERQLTTGDFEVGDVYSVDPGRKFADYASNQGNPVEQQIWQVSFNGERKQLSAGAGFHEAAFAPNGEVYLDTYSTRMTPPLLQLCQRPDTTGTAASPAPDTCREIWQTHALDAYHLRAPEPLQIKAHDGTTLYATLLLPEGAANPAAAPLIVNPYGGPGEQSVTNQWKDALLFDELLAQHGFAVLHADNRGMGGRGRAFAQAAYHNFGPVQFQDQLTVVDAVLAKVPQLDPGRLGWWGWSWGGAFTLYAMTHSDRFRAGVAVAPVTDWRDYDSIYTERYLGLPVDNPQVYRDFSVVNSAANLKGRLLIAHGAGDDNVHIENTVQVVQKLIEAGIPYDLQIYPRQMHSIGGSDDRTSLYNRILEQFEQVLKPETPTAGGNYVDTH